ncbi:hypothetical protein WJX74_007256 [Apatococcus lobatus]|uniref:Nucleotide-diphospho-sugar transferase domain-containing protein n=1 Tax=Apatococcus lobatus TaxID=904363 RepID=A0AAW1SG59_9CHLO
MNSDAGLTPEQQLHRSAWSLANAVQQGKQLSQEELETVIDKFSRMLSTRSDYDKDASEFVAEQKRLELDNAPPSWLPTLMQQKPQTETKPAMPADPDDLVNTSQLSADAANLPQLGSTQALPGSPPLKLQQQQPSPSAVKHAASSANNTSAADQQDVNLLLDPTVDEAYDVASWPTLKSPSGAGQQTNDQQQPVKPEDVPATGQTSPIARHLQSTGWRPASDRNASRSIQRATQIWDGMSPGKVQYSGQPDDYVLTRGMIRKHSVDNTLMVTWANAHYLDFVLNWASHVEAANISTYLVGALDDELLEALVSRGVPTFAMNTGLSASRDLGWGSPDFFLMGREKIKLLELFTTMGFDVLLSDVDTLWMRNPIPYVQRFPEADILFASDNLKTFVEGESLEEFRLAASAGNIGILFFRASALPFVQEWNVILAEDDHYWDQNAFNDLFRRGLDFSEEHSQRLFKGYDGRLHLGALPVSLFCNGHTFFVQRLHDSLKVEPYVIHTVFQFSGTPGKRHRLREEQLWSDPPEYYDPPGGLMSFDLKVEGLLPNAAPKKYNGLLEDFEGHFTLVRSALIIAAKLNRTLIMPQLWCGADRYWAPHAGHIPPTDFPLPFPCPMDHIFDLEQMEAELPEADFGPNIRFRESSFLASPNLPPSVKGSQLTLRPCEADGGIDCADGVHTQPVVHSNTVRLQTMRSDAELAAGLQAYAGVKVLHFADVVSSLRGHANNDDAIRFQERGKIFTSIWCCVDRHPGHVWYDMFWDIEPHTDRHRRKIPGPWIPLTGP